MTYHIICPLSRKRFDFESLVAIRRFVVAIFKRKPGTPMRLRVYDGKKLCGTVMRLDNGMVLWKSNGVRKKRILNDNGTIRL